MNTFIIEIFGEKNEIHEETSKKSHIHVNMYTKYKMNIDISSYKTAEKHIEIIIKDMKNIKTNTGSVTIKINENPKYQIENIIDKDKLYQLFKKVNAEADIYKQKYIKYKSKYHMLISKSN